MKIIADTNILIRAAVRDDKKQAQAVTRLTTAEIFHFPLEGRPFKTAST